VRYLSVCSGIEAATAAWHPLGWEPVAFSEVEPFPSAVLAQHYPDVPNLGDMTQIDGSKYNGSVDLIVGGTPCQSFSVAGLRGGMEDPRGNLALAFLGLVDTIRPRYFVWENVPGVLSSSGGRDFGSFVGAVAQLGYRGGWRVLDAAMFGLAQRRKRVFFVGCSPAAERGPREILFERESLCGDSPPSREAGEGTSPGTRGGAPVAHALNGRGGAGRFDAESETLTPTKPSHWDGDHPHPTLNQSHNTGSPGYSNQELFSQRGGGLVPSASAPLPFDTTQVTSPGNYSSPKEGDPVHPLAAGAHPPAVAFDARQDPVVTGDQSPTLGTRDTGHGVGLDYAVRRLTPIECERLQGFPDDYTRIPWKGKAPEDCPDGPRYKALGNSMAVTVMRWIGERLRS
jgi:DNA (cytosine-5)-methyltransferase 1